MAKSREIGSSPFSEQFMHAAAKRYKTVQGVAQLDVAHMWPVFTDAVKHRLVTFDALSGQAYKTLEPDRAWCTLPMGEKDQLYIAVYKLGTEYPKQYDYYCVTRTGHIVADGSSETPVGVDVARRIDELLQDLYRNLSCEGYHYLQDRRAWRKYLRLEVVVPVALIVGVICASVVVMVWGL